MTTGTKCCEHHREGLPYCVDCAEESVKAHDKACALLAEARADAEHWKSECNALQRMVHESRADIARKDGLIEQMREALKGASKHFDRNYWNVKNDPDFEDLNEIWSNIEAALAAERGE